MKIARVSVYGDSLQVHKDMDETLLIVTAPVVRMVNGVGEIDADTTNNFRLYLKNFSRVTFACPVAPNQKNSGILRSLPFDRLEDSERLSFIPLPHSYREDRHLRYYRATRKLLRSEIQKADYLLFSPHSMFDWPTLAALEAIKMKRKYVFEFRLGPRKRIAL